MTRLHFLALTAVILISVLLATAGSAGAQQFLCVADKGTGFAYSTDSKTWDIASFNIDDDRYLIAPSNPVGLTPNLFLVTKLGQSSPRARCSDGFNRFGFLICTDGIGGVEFRFSRDNLRFIYIYRLGYYNVVSGRDNGVTEESDTPFMQIGKCSPFSVAEQQPQR